MRKTLSFKYKLGQNIINISEFNTSEICDILDSKLRMVTSHTPQHTIISPTFGLTFT